MSMVNLGFLYHRQDRVTRRIVAALVSPAYDRLTGKQIVVGRRNDNSWIYRSDNPVDDGNSDLVTYLWLVGNSIAAGGSFSHHVLWAFPEWSDGEVGKSGLGHNLYESRDDCATWAAISEFSDVVDYGPQTALEYVLHDGGDALSFRPNGIFGDAGNNHDFTLPSTMNRVAMVHRIAQGGSVTRLYVVLMAADGVYVLIYDFNSSLNSFTVVSFDGPTGWATVDPLPWSRHFFPVDPGDNGALSDTYLVMQPIAGGGAYSIPLDNLTPAGGGWTLDLASTISPTMLTATYMATAGGRKEFDLYNWNSSRVWINLDMRPDPSSPTNARGVFDGGEAIFSAGLPEAQAGIGAAQERLLTIDPADPHTVITSETVRTAYLFLGGQPGDASSPPYTALRLVSLVRRASTTLEYNDESHLLDIGGVQYTTMVLYSGLNVNPTVLDPSWRDVIG